MIKTPDTKTTTIPDIKRGRSARKTVQQTPHDPWADWQPVWNSKTKKAKTTKAAASPAASVHDLQEKHSPTTPAPVTGQVSRDDRARQRRIIDARLWDAMTAVQQEAALQIALSFEVMSRGLGYVSSDWRRIPGCRGRSDLADAHSRLIGTYLDWVRECHKEKTSHAMIVDILVFGLSCRAVDRARRIRAGTARQVLFQGVDIYCRLRGWQARPVSK